MNPTPMAKRSKRAQRAYHAAKRGSWNGLSPVTRVVQSKNTYDLNLVKADARRANDGSSPHSASQMPNAAGIDSRRARADLPCRRGRIPLLNREKHRKRLAKSSTR